MNDAAHPIILYVPGLLPKPEPAAHRAALLNCLLAGLQRIDAPVANAVETTMGGFDVVSWTFDFYREYRDITADAAAIEGVIRQLTASERDVAEASSWKRRLARWVYTIGDRLPFLIPHVASERTELHLRDLHRYVADDNGIAEHTRRMLKIPLRAATGGHHPVLLIAHSMGSVIAYDSLWEMSHNNRDHVHVDLMLTMGSPLGQRYMQKRIKGHDLTGVGRYPANVGRWKNLSAVGDLTAIDPRLQNDFGEMLSLGLVESFEDKAIYNYFRLDGVLNVHAEYGYLVNEETARTVADWWRRHDTALVAG
ncbi:MAG: hypothetical protein ACR2QZ_07700 [Woeseiaceae bacterium]